MICSNCGKKLDGVSVCPICGDVFVQSMPDFENKKTRKKKQMRKIILTVTAVILSLALIIGVLFVFNRQKSFEVQQTKLKGILKNSTDKTVVDFICEDFDSDGIYEAFAITSLFEKTDDFYVDSDVWFVNQESAQKIKEKVVCKNNGLINIKGKNFVSIEIKTEKTSFSYIYSVDGKTFIESDFSGEYSGVRQQNGKVIISDNEGVLEAVTGNIVVNENGVTETENTTTFFTEETMVEKVTANNGEKVEKKTSTTKKNITPKEEPSYDFSDVKVGDYIKFGFYEQDNNKSNGKEIIDWLVIDKQSDKILVISKYILDCQQYHNELVDITWELSTIRYWLNNDFLNSAFTSKQKSRIPTVTIQAEDNLDYGTEAGKNTQDKVFLLSISEANKYFLSDGERECKTTAYAEKQGVTTFSEYFGNGFWWLRSPGYMPYYGSDVFENGSISDCHHGVTYDAIGIRPSVWIYI